MKNLFALTLLMLSGLILLSCDSTDDPITPTPDPKGSLFVSSIPSGAQIWVNGLNSNKVTPDTVTNLDPAVYNVTLKLQDYNDSTFQVSVSANQTSVVTNVELTSDIYLTSYGPVRIWETIGTTASQPSGLDLSSGNAYGVAGADKGNVDIYYSSTGTGGQPFLVQSANLNTTNGLTRETAFRVGSAGTLNDGLDSPLRSSGTWTNNMGDRETNYVFLYDDDGHYSKLKIVSFGGGTPGNPAWVEVEWFYNTTTDDNRF